MTNTLALARELKEILGDDWREAAEAISLGENDFTVAEYRFINASDIDGIMIDELSSDTYTLGGFRDWFIADIIDLPVDIVKQMQEKEQFEALGILMLRNIEEVAERYASADSYGAHFSSYDGEERGLVNAPYYYFKN